MANILTIAIIGLALYLVYRKNEDRLKALDSKIDQKVEDVKTSWCGDGHRGPDQRSCWIKLTKNKYGRSRL